MMHKARKELENVSYIFEDGRLTFKASLVLRGDAEKTASFSTSDAMNYINEVLKLPVEIYNIINPVTIYNNYDCNRHGVWVFEARSRGITKKIDGAEIKIEIDLLGGDIKTDEYELPDNVLKMPMIKKTRKSKK